MIFISGLLCTITTLAILSFTIQQEFRILCLHKAKAHLFKIYIKSQIEQKKSNIDYMVCGRILQYTSHKKYNNLEGKYGRHQIHIHSK